MNFMRAVGFLAVGLVLQQIPHWAPSWCTGLAGDGSSTRLIWLQLMGTLQIGIAGFYFVRSTGGVLTKLMRYEPRPYVETPKLLPARAWKRPMSVVRRAYAGPVRKRTILSIPVPFRPRAIEQRRAA